MMHIGFIGLGQLGSRLARVSLQSGRETMVFDLSQEAMDNQVEHGAKKADSANQLDSQCDTVITCLPSPAATQTVMLGDQGALNSMQPGSTWIEMSTTSVEEIKRIDQRCREASINLLEAPLTGGVHRAAKGEMTVLVGGEKQVFENQLDLLKVLGGEVIYMGETGSASLIKVITNLLCLVDLVAAGEALMLAKKGGLDLAQCYQAICASSGSSREFEDWAPVILNGSLNTGFTTDLCLKDLGFVADLGEQHNVPLQLTNLVKSMFEQSRDIYGGDAWTPHVVKMLEQKVGEELRADGFPEVIQPE
jgi:3-hydroxyisobutyrate dehydrogenase